jgi:[phosphatase 2A protein]-leucine-carboxy methyltransferase
MSAPQIPKLKSLRRGGLRSRGNVHGSTGGHAASPGGRLIKQDAIVQNTDNDAATSRLSAVDAGYLDDPFAKELSAPESFQKRLPLMNRGRIIGRQ